MALIDQDKSNIMDIKNKKYVRAIPMWGGSCSSDGRYGLYAPSRGGLDMLGELIDPLLICTWFLKNQFGKITFNKLDF